MNHSNVDNDQPKHTHSHNEDCLNLHNSFMLSLWTANVDFQPSLSIDVVIKYIIKYATKVENKFETYHEILSHISTKFESDKRIPNAFQNIILENLVDCDIGVQETYHLLPKFPLSLFGKTFISLIVNQKNFQHVLTSPTYKIT